jgi:hypothetical protein
VHNDDVVDTILLAVARRKELPSEVTLLIGEDESLSYDEQQRAFGRLIHGVEWKTWAIPPLVAKIGIRLLKVLPLRRSQSIAPWMIDVAQDNVELDITRARKILGWKPRHLLLETIPKMVSGLKADPFTWYRENELELPLWLRELMPAPEVDQSKAMMEDPHELMRLAQQVRHEIAASARMSPPSSTPPKQEKHHDMMDMHMGDSEAE